jgi:hypothetical protein
MQFYAAKIYTIAHANFALSGPVLIIWTDFNGARLQDSKGLQHVRLGRFNYNIKILKGALK